MFGRPHPWRRGLYPRNYNKYEGYVVTHVRLSSPFNNFIRLNEFNVVYKYIKIEVLFMFDYNHINITGVLSLVKRF